MCVAACHCTDSCTTRTTAQVAATWPTTSGMFFQVSNKTLNIGRRSLSKLITDVANVTYASLVVTHLPLTSVATPPSLRYSLL